MGSVGLVFYPVHGVSVSVFVVGVIVSVVSDHLAAVKIYIVVVICSFGKVLHPEFYFGNHIVDAVPVLVHLL